MKNILMIVFLFLILVSCSSTPTTSELIETSENDQNISDPQQTENIEYSLCEGPLLGASYDVVVKTDSINVDLIWRPEFMPFDISVGPENRIFAVPEGGEEIFEILSNGTVDVAFQCPGVQMATVAAASDGAIWFTTRGDCSLIRVASSGEFTRIYQNGNCKIEPGPDGTVYAMDNGIIKVYPDGRQVEITDQVQDERSLAVSSRGEVFVGTFDGRILRVEESGSVSELVTGLCLEPEVFFNPSDELFVNNCGKIEQVDLTSGNMSTLPWIINPNGASVFIDNTHIIHYHSSLNDILISDTETHTTELFYDVKGYSNAFALDPEDNVYVAFGDDQQEGITDLYTLSGDELKYLLSFPYGEERAMTIDLNGIGFIALGDSIKGGVIYQFNPDTLTSELYQKTTCIPSTIGHHPVSNQIWWDDCGDFFSKSADGGIISISGVGNISYYSGLVITDEDEFFTIGFHPTPNNQTPNPRFLYKYDTDSGTWDQIVNLTQRSALVPLATVTSCPNGDIFLIQGVDQTWVPVQRISINALFKLLDDGTLDLLAFDISHDTNAAACDSENNLIFPTGGGIFKVSLPW